MKIDFSTIFETFIRIGGPEIGALAESYWTNPTAEGREIYRQRCVPFYRHRRNRSTEAVRAIMKPRLHFILTACETNTAVLASTVN